MRDLRSRLLSVGSSHPSPPFLKITPCRPSRLTAHMNNHNNLKRMYSSNCVLFVALTTSMIAFPCIFLGCPKMFAELSNANRHLRRVHGINVQAPRTNSKSKQPKMYRCDICGRPFAQ